MPPDTLSIIPVSVTPEDLDLRLRSIDMPPDAQVVCEALWPLEILDRRLAGCIWKVLGREVALTEEFPDYPFLRLSEGDTLLRQVQVWMWQICLIDSPALVEYRWNPDKGEHLHFSSMSLDASERRQQFNRLDRLFLITKYRYRQGRPLNSGTFQNARELLNILVPVIQGCWRNGNRPTQQRVARLLPMKMGDRQLRQLCHDRGIQWEVLIEGVRQQM